MTDQLPCPDAAALEHFLVGIASDADSDVIERHLLTCDRCCHTLRSVRADDRVTVALKADTPLDALVEEPEVRATMSRLTALRPDVGRSMSEETMAVSGQSTDDAWGLEELLDPPRAEGELGWFGGYRVLRVLGAGGMGLVLEAEDPQLRRRVALKVMQRSLAARAEHRERFLREARAAAAIDHPHIVTVHQVGEYRGVPFLAMQLLRGEALDARLHRDERLPIAECVRIGRETAEALAVAHDRGLIHRDIKPANIWLESPNGWVKLVDFGLAHILEDEMHLTQTGTILGTPSYMSPEQARGDAVDARSDLFSLGAVLYQMTTGVTPFRAATTMGVLTALAVERPTPPRELRPDVPEALSQWIVRLLAKTPNERPGTAQQVAQGLKAIEQDIAKAEATGAKRSDAPVRRGPRWPFIAAAAAAAFILATIVVIVRDKDGKEVARLHVPEGGSVTVANGDVPASARREPPGKGGEPGEVESDSPLNHREADDARSPKLEVSEPPPLEDWLKGRESLTVAQDGSGQFKSIQAALEALRPGQVVNVLDRGPYREKLNVDGLPRDTGLISDHQAVVELPPWPEGAAPAGAWEHRLRPANDFRICGLRFVAQPHAPRQPYGSILAVSSASGFVIEDCAFAWTSPPNINPSLPPMAMALVSLGGSAAGDTPLVVRNCLFGTGDLTLAVVAGGGPPVVIERNYFKTAKFFLGGPRYHTTLVRHNLFEFPTFDYRTAAGIYVFNAAEGDGILELTNNTAINCGIGLGMITPKYGFVIRNNITALGITSEEKTSGFVTNAVENWQLGHNSYTRDGTLPQAPTDVVPAPPFMSADYAARDFARILADSPLASGGAGGDLPDYIGALPPGAAPKEGDWFTRLQERWLPVVSDGVNASEKIAPPGGDVAGNRTAPAGATAVRDAERPFVLIRASGNERNEFKRFAEAAATLRDGDVIEVHGNGPFTVPAVRLEGKGLTIRAAPGYRPVFVASKSIPQNQAWFEIQGGPLTLDGCDFHAEGQFLAFRGGGAPWTWRNCRILTKWITAEAFGPRLAISDSLIWSGDIGIHIKSHTEMELNNNVVRCVQHAIFVDRAAGDKFTLTHNTFLSGAYTWIVPGLQAGAEPLEINAEANIFDLRAGASLLGDQAFHASTTLDAYRTAIRWRGHNNFYCGPKGPTINAKDDSRRIEGLVAWREFWNTEEMGSVETPELSFTWDSARVLPTPEAIAWLHGVVDGAKNQEAKDLPELGPDWELVGPGDPYVRALATRDQPVPTNRLRPEPPDEGPFVVLREGQPVGGHVTLQEAINAAQNGDTIEIRTDGPFDGATTAHAEGGRSLVIRAAPGYLPVLEGALRGPNMNDLTVEGIHFKGGPTDVQEICTGPLHLVNCSFAADSRQTHFLLGMAAPRGKGGAAEIINCWAPGQVHLNSKAGTSILVRNSAVASFFLYSADAGEQQLQIERSALWNPGCGAAHGDMSYHPQCLFTRQGEGRLTVCLEQSLLETAQGLVPDAALNILGWKNAGNLYRTGTSSLVERLRAQCSSGDEGSVAAPPFDFDPQQWRLLPGSPGREAGPGGKDLGADVSRIGVTP